MSLNNRSRQSYRLINYTLLVLFVVGLLWLLYGPVTPSCYYQDTYGMSCPTCGLTRDFKSILSGDFSNLISKSSLYFFVAFSLIFLTRILANMLLNFSNIRKVFIVYEVAAAIIIGTLLVFGLSQSYSQ